MKPNLLIGGFLVLLTGSFVLGLLAERYFAGASLGG